MGCGADSTEEPIPPAWKRFAIIPLFLSFVLILALLAPRFKDNPVGLVILVICMTCIGFAVTLLLLKYTPDEGPASLFAGLEKPSNEGIEDSEGKKED